MSAAESVVRRGMPAQAVPKPEPAKVVGIHQPKCYLCQLQKQHPDIAERIHAMHFAERRPYRDIIAALSPTLENRGYKSLKLAAFTAHFSRHVPANAAFVHAVQATHAMRELPKEQAPAVMDRVLAYKRESIGQMQENLERWQTIMTAVYDQMKLGETDADGRPAFLSQAIMRQIAAMREATQAIATITATMDRFVSSKDFILSVLDSGVRYFSTRLSLQIGGLLIKLREEATDRNVPKEEIATWFQRELAEALAPVMADLREDTQRTMIEQHRLGRNG